MRVSGKKREADEARTTIAQELGRLEARLAHATRALQAIVDAPMYGDDEGWQGAERGEIARMALADLDVVKSASPSHVTLEATT